jgi:hypothetical protein
MLALIPYYHQPQPVSDLPHFPLELVVDLTQLSHVLQLVLV